MNETAPSTFSSGSSPDSLGPLQPQRKPRKAANVVLSGLLAAAGIAGGTGIVCGGPADAQEPPEATTKPASRPIKAERRLLLGSTESDTLKVTTRPSQPATMGAVPWHLPGAADSEVLSNSRTYEIQTGDTLTKIARAQLGDATRCEEILKLNPGIKPTRLKIGQVINLPAAQEAPSERK